MKRLAGLLLLLPVLATAATSPGSCAPRDLAAERAMDDFALAIAARTAAGNDARAMVMASEWLRNVDALREPGKSLEADRLLTRAAELAGPDPVAWRMIARGCGKDCAITPEPHARWLALDADNAAAWSEELLRALAVADEVGARDALSRAARAPRFDWYWVESIRAALLVARAEPAPPEVGRMAEEEGFPARDAADLYGLGVAMSQALPALMPLVEACATQVEWRDDCLRLAQTMEQRSDSQLARTVGRWIGRRLLSADSPEGRALAARELRYQWQAFQVSRVPLPDDVPLALQRLLTTGSEPLAFELQLREAGISLDPPPGWTVEDARAALARRATAVDPEAPGDCETRSDPSKP